LFTLTFFFFFLLRLLLLVRCKRKSRQFFYLKKLNKNSRKIIFVERKMFLWRNEEINYNFTIPRVLNVNTQTFFLNFSRAPRGLDTTLDRCRVDSDCRVGGGIGRKITFPSTAQVGREESYAHTDTYKHDKKRPTKHKS